MTRARGGGASSPLPRLRIPSTRAALAVCLALAFAGCHRPPRTAPTRPDSRTHQQLRRDLDAILSASPLQRGYWGVLVKSLKSDETLYALNARKLMMPASALKVVTLAAAAEQLGWDFTYETKILAVGAVTDGVLNGDLVVVGSGDPSLTDTLTPPPFSAWADQLKAAGISTIAGRVIGDDSALDNEPLGTGWAWDDLPEAYAAGVGALQYNENMARVTVTAGPDVGAPAIVTVEPDAAGLIIHNRLTTREPDTTGLVQLRRPPGSNELEVRGSLPLGNPAAVRLVSVDNPTMYFVSALRQALIAGGIDVRGPAVDIDDIADAPARETGAAVVTYRSPPLSTLALRLMKHSQNQYGETFLRTLGVPAGLPTAAGGAAAVSAIVTNWGLGDGDVIQRDGSGLSRYNYATPEALVTILARVHRDDTLREPFEASLPVAGVDGSLANRMKGTAAEGNARAKTGSMSNVRALSGYVTTADGEPLVFAILANNFETTADIVTAAADAIVVRLAQFPRAATETQR